MFTPLSESKKPQIYGGTQNFQKLGAKKNKKIKRYPDKPPKAYRDWETRIVTGKHFVTGRLRDWEAVSQSR